MTNSNVLERNAKLDSIDDRSLVTKDGEKLICDAQVTKCISANLARKYVMIPVKRDGQTLTVAMKDIHDIYALDDLQMATSLEIKAMEADKDEILELIEKFYGESDRKKKADELQDSQKNEEPEMDTVPDSKAEKGNQDIGAIAEPLVSYEGERQQSQSMFKEKLGDMLLRSGEISSTQLQHALELQKKTGKRLGEILVSEGWIEKNRLYEILEIQLEIKRVDLTGIEVHEGITRLISEAIARKYMLIPLELDDFTLKVAMSDPTNIFSIDDLRLATGLEIEPVLADAEQIEELLDRCYRRAKVEREVIKKPEDEPKKSVVDFDAELKKVHDEIAVEIKEFEEEEDIDISDVQNAPIVKMVNLIFSKAVASRASDIHIESLEDYVLVRYRIDGQLVEVMKHEKKVLPSMVARIKIISGLNIAEKRLPQDGRITMKIDERNFDMRVSILPTMFGEKTVIRLVDKEGFNVNKKQLGFFEDDLKKFEDILSHPHGIVLVTGPTGSGKSTTLYTALQDLCRPNVNILTVEDPVEATIRGVNQVQVNVKAGLTFATALRAFLRQDPDIIMVGEIRDGETAEIAIRAAITGHLVLSTLHTNDAASSITRMIDMGVEPYMISSSVVGVIAQRLVRRLCSKCRQAYTPGSNEKELLRLDGADEEQNISLYLPGGCEECNGTGYKGRIAIYEIMTIGREIREMIARNVTSDVLKDYAVRNGMKTLRENCARLVKQGITTVDELLRVTFDKN